MLLGHSVQLMMLYIKYMSMMSTLTSGVSYLPPSGHYYGVPHTIGGKLMIIGGCLSATKKGSRTNKVSTFDEGSQS